GRRGRGARRLRSVRAAALRDPLLPRERGCAREHLGGDGGRELRRDRRQGAAGEPPRRARSAGEDEVRGPRGDLRGSVPVPALARRAPDRARGRGPRAGAAEVPVKFAQPLWLLGTLLALLVGGLLVWGALRGVKALRRFGEEGPVEALLT